MSVEFMAEQIMARHHPMDGHYRNNDGSLTPGCAFDGFRWPCDAMKAAQALIDLNAAAWVVASYEAQHPASGGLATRIATLLRVLERQAAA